MNYNNRKKTTPCVVDPNIFDEYVYAKRKRDKVENKIRIIFDEEKKKYKSNNKNEETHSIPPSNVCSRSVNTPPTIKALVTSYNEGKVFKDGGLWRYKCTEAGDCLKILGYSSLEEAVSSGARVRVLFVDDMGLRFFHCSKKIGTLVDANNVGTLVQKYGQPQAGLAEDLVNVQVRENYSTDLYETVTKGALNCVFEGTPDSASLNRMASKTGVFPHPVMRNAIDVDCFVSRAHRMPDFVNAIHARFVAERVGCWRVPTKIMLVNPSVNLVRQMKKRNLDLIIVLSAYNHDYRCMKTLPNDTYSTKAVQGHHLRSEVLPCSVEDTIIYVGVDELAETIRNRRLPVHTIVTEDLARQVVDVIWADIAQSCAYVTSQDVIILHMECAPIEIMAVTSHEKAERYYSSDYNIQLVSGVGEKIVDVVDAVVGSTELGRGARDHIECNYQSDVCESTLQVKGRVDPWLEKLYTGTNDGMFSSTGMRRIACRTGMWVVLEDKYSVLSRRDKQTYSIMDDYKLVAMVDTRVRKFLGFSPDQLTIIVPYKLVQTMMSVSTTDQSITNDNNTIKIREKTEAEQRAEIMSILAMRLATIKLFDTTAEQLIHAMKPEVSRAFLASIVQLLLGLSRAGEKKGGLAKTVRAVVRLRTWFSPRSRYARWLAKSISYGSHNWALTTGLAYKLAYNPFVAEKDLRGHLVNPLKTEAPVTDYYRTSLAMTVLRRLALVGGEWDCVYVAMKAAGFGISEKFMKEKAAPMSVDDMYGIFESICKVLKVKFIIYKNGDVERECGKSKRSSTYHFVLTEDPHLHIVFTRKELKFMKKLKNVGRSTDVTYYFDTPEVRNYRTCLQTSFVVNAVYTTAESIGIDAALRILEEESKVSGPLETKGAGKRFRIRWNDNSVEIVADDEDSALKSFVKALRVVYVERKAQARELDKSQKEPHGAEIGELIILSGPKGGGIEIVAESLIKRNYVVIVDLGDPEPGKFTKTSIPLVTKEAKVVNIGVCPERRTYNDMANSAINKGIMETKDYDEFNSYPREQCDYIITDLMNVENQVDKLLQFLKLRDYKLIEAERSLDASLDFTLSGGESEGDEVLGEEIDEDDLSKVDWETALDDVTRDSEFKKNVRGVESKRSKHFVFPPLTAGFVEELRKRASDIADDESAHDAIKECTQRLYDASCVSYSKEERTRLMIFVMGVAGSGKSTLFKRLHSLMLDMRFVTPSNELKDNLRKQGFKASTMEMIIVEYKPGETLIFDELLLLGTFRVFTIVMALEYEGIILGTGGVGQINCVDFTRVMTFPKRLWFQDWENTTHYYSDFSFRLAPDVADFLNVKLHIDWPIRTKKTLPAGIDIRIGEMKDADRIKGNGAVIPLTQETLRLLNARGTAHMHQGGSHTSVVIPVSSLPPMQKVGREYLSSHMASAITRSEGSVVIICTIDSKDAVEEATGARVSNKKMDSVLVMPALPDNNNSITSRGVTLANDMGVKLESKTVYIAATGRALATALILGAKKRNIIVSKTLGSKSSNIEKTFAMKNGVTFSTEKLHETIIDGDVLIADKTVIRKASGADIRLGGFRELDRDVVARKCESMEYIKPLVNSFPAKYMLSFKYNGISDETKVVEQFGKLYTYNDAGKKPTITSNLIPKKYRELYEAIKRRDPRINNLMVRWYDGKNKRSLGRHKDSKAASGSVFAVWVGGKGFLQFWKNGKVTHKFTPIDGQVYEFDQTFFCDTEHSAHITEGSRTSMFFRYVGDEDGKREGKEEKSKSWTCSCGTYVYGHREECSSCGKKSESAVGKPVVAKQCLRCDKSHSPVEGLKRTLVYGSIPLLHDKRSLVLVDGACMNEVHLFKRDIIQAYNVPILGIHCVGGEFEGKSFDHSKSPDLIVRKGAWVLLRHRDVHNAAYDRQRRRHLKAKVKVKKKEKSKKQYGGITQDEIEASKRPVQKSTSSATRIAPSQFGVQRQWKAKPKRKEWAPTLSAGVYRSAMYKKLHIGDARQLSFNAAILLRLRESGNLVCFNCSNDVLIFHYNAAKFVDSRWLASADHIIPRSVDPGKSEDPRNIQVMCVRCNQAKSNRDSVEFKRDPTDGDVRALLETEKQFFTIDDVPKSWKDKFANRRSKARRRKETTNYAKTQSKANKWLDLSYRSDESDDWFQPAIVNEESTSTDTSANFYTSTNTCTTTSTIVGTTKAVASGSDAKEERNSTATPANTSTSTATCTATSTVVGVTEETIRKAIDLVNNTVGHSMEYMDMHRLQTSRLGADIKAPILGADGQIAGVECVRLNVEIQENYKKFGKEQGENQSTRIDFSALPEIARIFNLLWPNTALPDQRITTGALIRKSEFYNFKRNIKINIDPSENDLKVKEKRILGFNHDGLPIQNKDPFFATMTMLLRFGRATPHKTMVELAKNDPLEFAARTGKLKRIYDATVVNLISMLDKEKISRLRISNPANEYQENIIGFFEAQAQKQSGILGINEQKGHFDERMQRTLPKTQVKGQDFKKLDDVTKRKMFNKGGQPVNVNETFFSLENGKICKVIEAIIGCLKDQFQVTAMRGNTTQSARLLMGKHIEEDDVFAEGDVSGMDSSHTEVQFIWCLVPLLNLVGRMLDFGEVGDVFYGMIQGAQKEWATKEFPGQNARLKTVVDWIMGSGLRWTLALNSLRTLMDIVASVGVPKWLVAQGDDSLFGLTRLKYIQSKAVGADGLRNFERYSECTGIQWKLDFKQGIGLFCNEIWCAQTCRLVPNIARMLMKFLCAPLPLEKEPFKKRVGEIRVAIADLFVFSSGNMELAAVLNNRNDDRLSINGYRVLIDFSHAMSNSSWHLWWMYSRKTKIYSQSAVMDWNHSNK